MCNGHVQCFTNVRMYAIQFHIDVLQSEKWRLTIFVSLQYNYKNKMTFSWRWFSAIPKVQTQNSCYVLGLFLLLTPHSAIFHFPKAGELSIIGELPCLGKMAIFQLFAACLNNRVCARQTSAWYHEHHLTTLCTMVNQTNHRDQCKTFFMWFSWSSTNKRAARPQIIYIILGLAALMPVEAAQTRII